jgi:hypothetical protein
VVPLRCPGQTVVHPVAEDANDVGLVSRSGSIKDLDKSQKSEGRLPQFALSMGRSNERFELL